MIDPAVLLPVAAAALAPHHLRHLVLECGGEVRLPHGHHHLLIAKIFA